MRSSILLLGISALVAMSVAQGSDPGFPTGAFFPFSQIYRLPFSMTALSLLSLTRH